MRRHLGLLAATASLIAATPVAAVVITFDDLAPGEALSTQYADLGVVFSANTSSALVGPGNWATNTDLTIVTVDDDDIGALYGPSLVGGNIVRSFSGWQLEDGDPSVLISFTVPVGRFSLAFAGITYASSTRIHAFNGDTLLGTVAAPNAGQSILSFAAPLITSVVVEPGEAGDWVAFDNLEFGARESIPEPASWALMIAGFGLVGAAMRRRAEGLHAAIRN